MTPRMKRLVARIDGLPTLIEHTGTRALTAKAKATNSAAERSRVRTNPRADWMTVHVPREIERLVLTDVSEIRHDLAAAGLM